MNKDYLLALLISLATFLACREGIFKAVADDTQLLWWFNQRYLASDGFLEFLDKFDHPTPRVWYDETPLDDKAIPEIYSVV